MYNFEAVKRNEATKETMCFDHSTTTLTIRRCGGASACAETTQRQAQASASEVSQVSRPEQVASVGHSNLSRF